MAVQPLTRIVRRTVCSKRSDNLGFSHGEGRRHFLIRCCYIQQEIMQKTPACGVRWRISGLMSICLLQTAATRNFTHGQGRVALRAAFGVRRKMPGQSLRKEMPRPTAARRAIRTCTWVFLRKAVCSKQSDKSEFTK